MNFPWNRYEEIPLESRNTLQIFITNRCNLKCDGCFARNVMGQNNLDISLKEYERAVLAFVEKGGRQINLLGGEPFLHPNLLDLILINKNHKLKTTIYTNGEFLDKYTEEELKGAKIRTSVYSFSTYNSNKDLVRFKLKYVGINPKTPFEVNYMVSSKTTLEDLYQTAIEAEVCLDCKVFFISSLRELDNDRKEFFDDTNITMPILEYKELVHDFLNKYNGDMEIHVSKRGVFESTECLPVNKCRFANYFIGGKIIQCPYDIVNEKYQEDYEFNSRYCQHNNCCLMSKVKYKKIYKK